jgi:hypothetical protein
MRFNKKNSRGFSSQSQQQIEVKESRRNRRRRKGKRDWVSVCSSMDTPSYPW